MEKRAVLVAVGGASSSGKTSIAKILHGSLKGSVLLHQDDFYKSDKDIPIDEKTGEANWDCPDAINFDAFKAEINYIRKHCQLSPQTLAYENRYNSDTKDSGTLSDYSDAFKSEVEAVSHYVDSNNYQLFFIDGFMLFHDPEIINLFDIKLFLRAPYATLKQRRESRAGYQTQDDFWVDPPNYFDNIVYPAYAESHKFLFVDNNVENELAQNSLEGLNIKSYSNDATASLDTVSLWSIKSLREELQRI